ncbi:MAG: ATP-binding cassette domain-containing protein, partial [Roseiarcus sp.]
MIFAAAPVRARPHGLEERGEVEVNVEAPLRLKLIGVSKSFPGVRANDNVNLSVRPGEIHALLGENGAGKSTLVKMIYGILAPDEGEIVFDGAPVRISNPRAARRLGIGMVFQHFSLFEAMTVLENIALGLDARLSPRELLAEFNRVLEAYGLKLDPRRVVSTLSV